MRQHYARFMTVAIPSLISAALAVTVYYQSVMLAPLYRHNLETFTATIFELHPAWRPRLLSILLASALSRFDARIAGTEIQQNYVYSIGMWTAFWLAATFLVYVVVARQRSLFFLFGTYAAVSFGYMPGITARIYPWDMPPLFFFTLFVALVHTDRYLWLLIVLPIATGFKETAMILCVAFLFWRAVPVPKRIAYAAIALAGCILVKVGMALFVNNPALFFTMVYEGPAGDILLLSNLSTLLKPQLNYPIWINSATLVSFLLIPAAGPKVRMFKVIALVFIAATFVYGIITEYRIWFEMIPLALYGLYSFTSTAQQE